MIQAVVYDAVGTVMHVTPSVEAVYAAVGARFGSQLEAGEIRRRFRSAFVQQELLDEAAGWRTDEAREHERWRAIIAHVLDDVADPAGCFDALFAAFAQPEVWAFDPAWDELSTHFQKRGIRQAIASNFDCRLRGLLRALPTAKRMEHVVVSSEIGWRKPARKFFAHLITLLQLPPAEILFVGDDRANDFEAARRAGMRALLFDPDERHLDVGTDRVEKLVDLLSLWDSPFQSHVKQTPSVGNGE